MINPNNISTYLLQGLDMTPYVIQPGHGQAVYDLIAVSNHFGGMGGGHCKYHLYIYFPETAKHVKTVFWIRFRKDPLLLPD